MKYIKYLLASFVCLLAILPFSNASAQTSDTPVQVDNAPITLGLQSVEVDNSNHEIDLDITMQNGGSFFVKNLKYSVELYQGAALKSNGYIFDGLPLVYIAEGKVDGLAPNEYRREEITVSFPETIKAGYYLMRITVFNSEMTSVGLTYTPTAHLLDGNGTLLPFPDGLILNNDGIHEMLAGDIVATTESQTVLFNLNDNPELAQLINDGESIYLKTSIENIAIPEEKTHEYEPRELSIINIEGINYAAVEYEPWESIKPGSYNMHVSIVNAEGSAIADDIMGRWLVEGPIVRIKDVQSSTNKYKKSSITDLKVDVVYAGSEYKGNYTLKAEFINKGDKVIKEKIIHLTDNSFESKQRRFSIEDPFGESFRVKEIHVSILDNEGDIVSSYTLEMPTNIIYSSENFLNFYIIFSILLIITIFLVGLKIIKKKEFNLAPISIIIFAIIVLFAIGYGQVFSQSGDESNFDNEDPEHDLVSCDPDEPFIAQVGGEDGMIEATWTVTESGVRGSPFEFTWTDPDGNQTTSNNGSFSFEFAEDDEIVPPKVSMYDTHFHDHTDPSDDEEVEHEEIECSLPDEPHDHDLVDCTSEFIGTDSNGYIIEWTAVEEGTADEPVEYTWTGIAGGNSPVVQETYPYGSQIGQVKVRMTDGEGEDEENHADVECSAPDGLGDDQPVSTITIQSIQTPSGNVGTCSQISTVEYSATASCSGCMNGLDGKLDIDAEGQTMANVINNNHTDHESAMIIGPVRWEIDWSAPTFPFGNSVTYHAFAETYPVFGQGETPAPNMCQPASATSNDITVSCGDVGDFTASCNAVDLEGNTVTQVEQGQDFNWVANPGSTASRPVGYNWSGVISGTTRIVTGNSSSLGSQTANIIATDINDSNTEYSSSCSVTVVAETLNVSCSASPSDPEPGDDVTWTANAYDEDLNLVNATYEWTGDVSGNTQSVTETYDDNGSYTAIVKATYGNQIGYTQCGVQVNDQNVPDVCPNLTGNQSAIPNGYEFDDDGNCIRPGDPGPLTVACEAKPQYANIDEQVTWEAFSRYDSGTVTYEWSGDVSGNTQSITSTHSAKDTYTANIQIEDDDETATTTCYVFVDGGDGICPNLGEGITEIPEGYIQNSSGHCVLEPNIIFDPGNISEI